MLIIKLEFNTDNAAFEDTSEVPRILRQAVEHIEIFGIENSEYPLRDINGNRVGKVTITESES